MLQPDDGPQFATAKQVFNTNYNGYTPAVIVTPTSQLDVQKAMAFAAANNLKVAPRGGGHSSTWGRPRPTAPWCSTYVSYLGTSTTTPPPGGSR